MQRKRQSPSDSQVHEQMEKWISLRQFLFDLPDEYGYAVRIRPRQIQHGGVRRNEVESVVYLRMGWMSWLGKGTSVDHFRSVALSLASTERACGWLLRLRNRLQLLMRKSARRKEGLGEVIG